MPPAETHSDCPNCGARHKTPTVKKFRYEVLTCARCGEDLVWNPQGRIRSMTPREREILRRVQFGQERKQRHQNN